MMLIQQEINHRLKLIQNPILNIKIPNQFKKIIDTQFKMIKVFIINNSSKILK